MVSEKNDRLWTLPVEIALEIFSYLSIFKVWELQLVSRRWRSMLSSETFMRHTLARLEIPDPAESVRDAPSVTKDSLESRLRHLQATLRCRPFTASLWLEKLPSVDNHAMQGFPLRRHQLTGRRVAYIRSERRNGGEVVVRDLVTGEKTTLRGEARENLAGLTLTDTLAAFVSCSGVLYICRLSHLWEPPARVRLPSAQVIDLVGDGAKVAVLLRTSQMASYGSLLVYSLGHGLKGYRFALQQDHGRDLIPQRLFMDSIEHSVHVFSCSNQAREMGFSRLRRYGALGHVRFCLVDGQDLELRSQSVKTMCQGAWFYISEVDPFGFKGKLALSLSFDREELSDLKGGRPYIVFDAKSGRFSKALDYARGERAPMRLWKYKSFRQSPRFPGFHVFDGKLGFEGNHVSKSAFVPTSSSWLIYPSCQASGAEIELKVYTEHLMPDEAYDSFIGDDNVQHRYMINDTFMIIVQERMRAERSNRWTGFLVFCLDENVQLAGGQDTGLWPVDRDQWLKFARAKCCSWELCRASGRVTSSDDLWDDPPHYALDDSSRDAPEDPLDDPLDND